MRVALVHDWLTGMRGGEKCLENFLELYPDADVYSLVHVPGSTSPRIDKAVKGVSWFNSLPGVKRYYRLLLPLFPLATRSLNLSGYDLVISLSHAAVKNVTVPRGTVHVCYCFTPMRYAWDQAEHYFGSATRILQPVLAGLRAWDKRGSRGVTHFIAISRFVAARIRRFYGRRSTVLFPPTDCRWIQPSLVRRDKSAPFLYAGALVPYKRPHLAVQACTSLGLPLIVAGSGPEEARLKALAGPTVHFVGRVSDSELAELYKTTQALLFPGPEDFGMIPVEYMAAGGPVFGYYRGGLGETVVGTPWRKFQRAEELGLIPSATTRPITGLFFKGRSERAMLADLTALLEWYSTLSESPFQPVSSVRRAEYFSPERFRQDWYAFLKSNGISTDQGREASVPLERDLVEGV